jgi:signal transduction histidine kinase
LAFALAMPTVMVAPWMACGRFRRRWVNTPVGSTEYLITLVVASTIAAAIFNVGLRFQPTINEILNDPRLLNTAIRMFVPLWVINAVLGTMFARIQKESTTAQVALRTVVTQRRLLLESEERVRGQVAAYLHDRVQTDLVSIGLRIRAAVSPGPQEMVRQVDAALADLERVRSDEVRTASRQLSPNLGNVALDTALRELAHAYRPGMKVTVSVSTAGAERLRLRGEVTRATGIYRICEQALLNSAIHGHASECSIRVVLDERDAYVLEIRDNGVGLAGAPLVPGMGTTVISAWVESLQGEWSLEQMAVGMVLTATIPAA